MLLPLRLLLLFLDLSTHPVHGDLHLLLGEEPVVVSVPHVQRQHRLRGEPVVAVRTRFPLALLGMAGHVSVHIALLVEAPAAEVAGERLLARVGQQVSVDPAVVSKHLDNILCILKIKVFRNIYCF